MGAAMRFQPQGLLRLSRSNPLTRGLVVVLHPLQPGINLADGSPLVDAYGQGTSWTPTANPVGRAITNNSSTNYRISSNGSWTAPNGSTTAIVAIPRALVVSGANLLSWAGTGGWNTVSLYMGDGTNPRWNAGTNASGLQYTTAPSNYVVGTPCTVVATATGNAQNLIINGAVVATTAYATGNPQLAHAFTLNSPSVTGKVVEIGLALVWNRALTNDEAVSLSNNPWQLFDAGSSSSAYQAAIASTGAAAGGTGASTGNASITLGALSRTAAGSVALAAAQASGLAPAGINAGAGLAVAAQASAALNPATLSGTGTLGGGATLSLILAPAAASAAGSAAIAAGSGASFAPLAVTTAATLAIAAQGVPSLAPALLGADGNTTIARAGSLALALSPASVAAGTGVTVGAQLAASLNPASAGGAATAAIGAAFARQLAPLSASAAGTLPAAATLAAPLGGLSLMADGTRQINAAFSNQLGALSLASSTAGLSGANVVLYLGLATLAADAALTPLVFTPPPLLRALGLRYLMQRPYRKDRIVLLGKFIKQPAEREAYAIEYIDDLSVGDTLAQDQAPRILIERSGASTGAAVDATPLTLTALDVGGTRVTLWLAAGSDGAVYKITVTVTTASGRILQDEFIIRIKDY